MSDINDLTDEQLDAAFNDAAAEADSELSLSNFSGDDEHEGREPSQHDDLPEDDSDSVLSNQVQPQQQVSAPPRPAAQQADAPAWINSIADNATREQALSDWTRLRHSEASQKGRVASLNRKWSEAQELLKQREQGQAAGDNTAAQDDKLAQIAEDFPALAESLQALMEQKDKQWEQKFNRYAEPLQAIEEQRRQQAVMTEGALVAEKHPDWANIAGSDGFSDWVSESPHRTAMFNSDDAASTIELLDLFKAQHGLFNQSNQQSALRQRRRSQLSDLASLPNGGSSRLPMVDEGDEDALFAAAAKAADAELRRYR